MVIFYILFIDSMSLLILIMTIVFPLIQLFILKRISKNITATLNIENLTIPKNTESKIIVKIKNHSVLPVSCAVATLKISNTLTGEEQILTTMLPVSSDNEQSIKFSVSYAHCGRVAITLKSIRIYDYIKLFSRSLDMNISQEIVVLPSLISIEPEIETTISGIAESEEFSKIKPGDDCSEIFNIREYSYGDKINRIHWNLTTKLDDLMVKEYSLPVSSHIIIVFEFCTDPLSENRFYKNDAAIEATMSLSYYMIKNNISHRICWYDPRTKLFHSEKITCEDDFSEFLGAIFISGTYSDYYSAFIHHKSEHYEKRFSHTFYISPVLSDEIYHNLSVLNNSYKKTYIHISDNSSEIPEFFRTTDSITAATVDHKGLTDGLNRIVI